MKKYNALNEYLTANFGGKIGKISIDAGFSCPNRENGGKGCLFCTDSGGSEFSGNRLSSIERQISDGKRIVAEKWNCRAYIAYFQNFSNTYGEPAVLKEKYEEALKQQDIVGLAIATRPDCFTEEIFDLLGDINKKTFLWVELGFQTSNESTAILINRGYSNDIYEKTMNELNRRNIKAVIHLIAGLPGENKENFLSSIKYINKFNPWGVKLHNIYIQKNSDLHEFCMNTGFKTLGLSEYVDWVTDALMYLNEETVIHRITGDPDKSKLVEPAWIKHKLKVLSEIDRVLGIKRGKQGCRSCY